MTPNPDHVLIPFRPERSIFSGILADSRLAKMSLSSEHLRLAVEEGEKQRRKCTAHNTPGGPGFRAYDETIRALRDEAKAARGPWSPGVRHGLYGVSHEDGVLAVTVMTGDENTGLVGEVEPKSKNPKGPLVQQLARMHNGQGVFSWVAEHQSVTTPGDEELWVLLIHSAEEEVRFELSLPTAVDADDRICAWRERILFPPVVRPEPLQDTGELEGIDFEISRRA